MIVRIWYEVSPAPGGEDEGWNVLRDGHVVTWHSNQTDAVIEAVAGAVHESEDGTLTGYRCKDRAGAIKDSREYPRPASH